MRQALASVRDTSGLRPLSSVEREPVPARIFIHGINFAPELIGCAKYTTELGEFLNDRGHDVEVVAAPPHYPGWRVREPYRAFAYKREIYKGISVLRVPILTRKNGRGIWRLIAPLTFALSAAPVVLWRILRAPPDVVLCIEPTLFSAPVALLGARIVGARAILHVQDLEIDAAFGVGHLAGERLRRGANLVERGLLRGFDRIVTISGKMREKLIEKGIQPSKIAVLRNWIDLGRIFPLPKHSGNAYRQELGISETTFVVLYAGHVGLKQALHLVVEAARRLMPQQDILFVIAGDGPAKSSLVAMADGLSNLRFLPLQPAERLNELLNMADLHVLPQDQGASDLVFPSKLAGMLASGRPVVVTADSGSELAVLLSGIATIAPAGDADKFASAILAERNVDSAERVEKGLELAGSMNLQQALLRFETILLGEQELEPQGLDRSKETAPEARCT
jgi:colanic acid biosynthesis glycosyl transferase WcaI